MYLADYLMIGLIAYAVFCWYYCAGDPMMFLGILGSMALLVAMKGAVSYLTDIRGSAAALLVFLPGYVFLSIYFLLYKDGTLARRVRRRRKAKRQSRLRSRSLHEKQ